MTLAFLISLLTLLAGCAPPTTSTANAHPTSSAVDLDLPSKNIDQWALPLDSYILNDHGLERYAIDSTRDSCLRKRGYDLPPLYHFSIDGPLPANTNSAGMKFFNVQIAQQYGYAFAPDLRRSGAEFDTYFAVLNQLYESNSAFEKDSDECSTLAQKAVESSGSSGGLGNELALSVPETKDLPGLSAYAAKWKECMQKYGIPDLPNSPTEMPAISQTSGWGPLPPSPDQVRGPEEITAAVQDATCQESSGYLQARYDAQWDAEVSVMTEHAAELPAAKADVDRKRALIIEVARSYKP